MKIVAALALAGMAGTLCRYGIMQLPWGKGFPYATLAVNLAGAFCAGFCYSWLNGRYPQGASWFPVLFVGFFGAFTTFSTFMLDSAKLLDGGHPCLSLVNMCLQNGLGIGLALCGMSLARRFCL